MRLFVTGATGFIGSHFVNAALSAGHEVMAHKRADESRPRIELKVAPSWIVRPLDEIEAADFDRIDALVHLAGHSANVPYDTLENCMYWNVTVALNLFRIAVESGVVRFVVAGSCFEYGRAGERYEYIPVDAPLEPTQTYPTSKAAASVMFQGFAAETMTKLSIHRIFQVFGPGELESRLWPLIRSHATTGEDLPMTDAEQIRDFISVDLVAKSFLEACEDNSIIAGQPKIVNLGTGQPQSVRQFAEYWWRYWQATGRLRFGELPYRPGEVMRYVPQIT